MKRRAQHTQKEKGQSITELAIVLPVMLIILAGVLDLGRLYYAFVAVSDAAGEGANYGAIHPGESDRDELVARVQNATDGLIQIEPGRVTVDCPTVAGGAPITVTVGYTFTLATPFLGAIVPDGELMLNAVATEVILTGGM